ncbi:MAG: hypothetical protein A2622_06895 [Bdellovibrionales bacterium RIFCSPHIGHO2_01_FULL_40_29]|nr:MAG: hypothetical protein A2622_06895 [Bdellovibrionales bacterium RIFCSPHIGHO2_01_FULL_40_29]
MTWLMLFFISFFAISSVAQADPIHNMAQQIAQHFQEHSKLNKKFKFTAMENTMSVTDLKKNRMDIKIINSMAEKYVINSYPVDLFGLSPEQKLSYLKKVLISHPPKPQAISKLSLFINLAWAGEFNRWLSPEDMTSFGLVASEMTAAIKEKSCTEFQTQREKRNNSSLLEIMNGANAGLFSAMASRVGVAFWCGEHHAHKVKLVKGFSVQCEKGKVKNFAYATNDAVGTNVGLITETEKFFGNQPPEKFISKSFNADFGKAISDCCASNGCAPQINLIAPLPFEGTPTEFNNKVKSLTPSNR